MVFLKKFRNPITPLSLIFLSEKSGVDEPPSRNSVNQNVANKSHDYDPYDFGNKDNPLQYYGALFHFSKYIVGTGILSIPYAFKNVGFVIGIIGTLTVSFLYVHIVHTLLAVEYELCKRLQTPNLTYVGVVENAFKTASKKIRDVGPYVLSFLYFNYVFNGAVGNAGYLMIMAGNVQHIYDVYCDTNSHMKTFITALIVPLIALCWIPRLRFLIPLSMMTSVFTILNIIIILVIPIPTSSEIGQSKPVNNIYFFPQFFGLVLSALTATGLTLPIKNDMAKPKSFSSPIGVLNVSFLATSFLYAVFGLLGYLKYGETAQGNILMNLPKGQFLSILVYSLYTVAVCVSFTLSFYIIFDTIWSNYLGIKIPPNSRYEFVIKNGVKMLVNLFTYMVAIAVPNFELFASLTGTIGILMDIGIPPLLHIVVLWPARKKPWVVLKILKDFILIAVAVFLFVSGVTGSVIDIVRFYNK